LLYNLGTKRNYPPCLARTQTIHQSLSQKN
jgi:hypothetical protein